MLGIQGIRSLIFTLFVCHLCSCDAIIEEADDIGYVRLEDVSLVNDYSIADHGWFVLPGFTDGPFTLSAGQVAYMKFQGTVYESSFTENQLDVLDIWCGNSNSIWTTENYPDSGPGDPVPPERTRIARMLLLGPGTYTCQGRVYVGGSTATEQGTHTYKAGSTSTFMTRRVKSAGWRWGTDYEAATGSLVAYPDECCMNTNDCASEHYHKCRLAARHGEMISCFLANDSACENDSWNYESGIYLGPESNTTTLYVLHSSRFEVPTTATSIDVFSEPELTGCPERSYSCPTYREGYVSDIGTTVTLELIVQQMCSSTSSQVAIARHYDAQTFSITWNEHHKKAYLFADNVPFVDPRAPGPFCFDTSDGKVHNRSFIVKTLVTWQSDANVKVERGSGGATGYSTGFAYVNN